MKAVVVRTHGGPDVLRVEEMPVPVPGRGEVLVRHEAIGVNFVDTQHRAGAPYPVTLPLVPGTEAAGVVEAVGPEVYEFVPGDRVAYAGTMGTVYAEYGLCPAARLVPVPLEISSETAAGSLLQGMTAHALTHSAYKLGAGETALIQAAAGGVGLFLVQLAKRLGATVIGVTSGDGKASVVRDFGADHVIIAPHEEIERAVERITGGAGVHVVYDSVGRATFDAGLRSLRAMGHMVIFGLSSGDIPPFDVNRLSGITGGGERGSLFLTWATLNDYNRDRMYLLWRASDVFTWLGEGSIRVHIAARFPLSEAAEAHRLLQSRAAAGKVLLIP